MFIKLLLDILANYRMCVLLPAIELLIINRLSDYEIIKLTDMNYMYKLLI